MKSDWYGYIEIFSRFFYYYYFGPSLPLFILFGVLHFSYPSNGLRIELLHLSSKIYPKDWLNLCVFEILYAVDLSSVWNVLKQILPLLFSSACTSCIHAAQHITFLMFLRCWPTPAIPPLLLLSSTCHKVPDTSHTIDQSAVLSHAQKKKIIKENMKIWMLLKSKVWLTLQKEQSF